ncbi:MAG: T9SS C-terminal target domain-containing protein [Candidatus Zixiibacteriota bacterium]|nr:MAG: T9SS C-terminal target domain-containing protein [candidate division Zixibacteria bacterium]
MRKWLASVLLFGLVLMLAAPADAQNTYQIRVVATGTDWFKVMMYEMDALQPIDGSTIELVSTLLPIHSFDVSTDFFPNGGELSFSRVPFGPTGVQINFDVTVTNALHLACMKGSLGNVNIQFWLNNVFIQDFTDNLTGAWCFQSWVFDPTPAAASSTPELPTSETLEQNYPNPFNATTTIHYTVRRVGPVEISVYNVLGEQVRTLVFQHLQPGNYTTEWNGLCDDGTQAAAGTYFYQMRNADYVSARKMILLK